MSERRMWWIRNADALASVPPVETIEAELASEAKIAGIVAYTGITCGGVTFRPDASGLFKYVIRLQLPPLSGEFRSGTREGYVFREGPVGELVALLSLRLQCRLYVLSITIGELTAHGLPSRTEFPVLRNRYGPTVDSILFGDQDRSFHDDMPPFLDLIRRIPPKHHLRVVLAADHYARAVREIGVDEEMAFVRLVSAVETAARHHPVPDDQLQSVDLQNIIDRRKLTSEQYDELVKIFDVRRTKARFVAFLQQYSKDFLQNKPAGPEYTHVTSDNLGAVAAAIYDGRSAYLHAGIPMYLSTPAPDQPNWHMDLSLGRTWQGRSYTAEQKLPRVDFFHRLVRHCLLEYMRELAAPPSAG